MLTLLGSETRRSIWCALYLYQVELASALIYFLTGTRQVRRIDKKIKYTTENG